MARRTTTRAASGTKPRARRSGQRRPTPSPCSTEHAEARAKQIGSLYAEEARLVRELARVRHDRDRELVTASIEGVPGAVIGHATLVATGRAQTDAELRRAEGNVRKAAHKAKRRLRVAAGNKSHVAAGTSKRETGAMTKPIYTRESWYSPEFLPPDAGIAPPDAELADVEDMNREEALDHDLADEDDLAEDDEDE